MSSLDTMAEAGVTTAETLKSLGDSIVAATGLAQTGVVIAKLKAGTHSKAI